MMGDWTGLAFFLVLGAGAVIGLRLLSRPQKRTEAEFERNSAQSASMLGASMSALQGLLDPSAGKAKEVRIQLKEGRYNKKKREGKANSTAPEE